jgi:mannitol/fructose-specific phosphotransferase system IIA component (Ntr-type)
LYVLALTDLLTKEQVAVQVPAKDWRDAVRQVGRLLVQSGAVEERYIDGMIHTAEELGPYIVIAPGIAMPHSRPEDGVRRPCMALITLKDPINFGNAENDPVRLVFAFGAVDQKQHIEALSQLAGAFSRFFSEKGGIQSLLDARTPDELMRTMLDAAKSGHDTNSDQSKGV